jgi:hypothetical protein
MEKTQTLMVSGRPANGSLRSLRFLQLAQACTASVEIFTPTARNLAAIL